jgi:hypothetical protein
MSGHGKEKTALWAWPGHPPISFAGLPCRTGHSAQRDPPWKSRISAVFSLIVLGQRHETLMIHRPTAQELVDHHPALCDMAM